jgi:hypothetical protein
LSCGQVRFGPHSDHKADGRMVGRCQEEKSSSLRPRQQPGSYLYESACRRSAWPNITSSLEKPKMKWSLLSITVTSTVSPSDSDKSVESSSPPNPAPSTRILGLMPAPLGFADLPNWWSAKSGPFPEAPSAWVGCWRRWSLEPIDGCTSTDRAQQPRQWSCCRACAVIQRCPAGLSNINLVATSPKGCWRYSRAPLVGALWRRPGAEYKKTLTRREYR